MRFTGRMILSGMCAMIGIAGTARAVDDDAIDAALSTYDKLLHDSIEAGDRPGPAEEGKFIDQALAEIKLEELTAAQLLQIIDALPVRHSPKTGPAMDALLAKQAAASDRRGAEAAVVRLSLIPADAKAEEQLARLREALRHPAVKEAIAAGLGGPVFEVAGGLPATQLIEARPQLLALADSIRAEASVLFFSQAADFFMRAGKKLNEEELRKFGSLRERLVAALRDKLKGPDGSGARKADLEKSLEKLDGAFARGEFIGHAAPDIEFIWYRDPANPDQKVKSLADLKGKVVVLDFWATWCGACVGAFPKVKAVARYYRDYDVVVIGVTSLQGRHAAKGKSIDTTGKPEKEFELMAEFMQENDVTWPIGFAKTAAGPEYGVTAIPHAVIIDADGVVRYSGVDMDAPLAEKTKLIDGLLAEAKKPMPAIRMMRKPSLSARD